MRRWKRHTAADEIPAMVDYYNADKTRRFADVGKHFGISGERARQLIKPFVMVRRNTIQQALAKPKPAKIEDRAPAVLPVPTMRQLMERRARRLALLNRDPDVLRCRQEAKRRARLNAPALSEAKKQFKRLEREASRAATYRSDGTRRNNAAGRASA